MCCPLGLWKYLDDTICEKWWDDFKGMHETRKTMFVPIKTFVDQSEFPNHGVISRTDKNIVELVIKTTDFSSLRKVNSWNELNK